MVAPSASGTRFQLDHEPAAGARSHVPRVDGEPVGEVEHRGGSAGQLASLVEPDRRADVALLAEGGTGGAERARHDQHVAGPSAAAARDALRAARAPSR